ncbi:VPS10, VPS10 domain protein [Paenibacillus chondroitinus]|uniref:VPS10, VPS10 domain protein n=1 Tax=Paenibacillus chondroitinus TaxID=59842 RepID=A0ABU6DNN3_9BACL|nr:MULTISPECIES: glycosyl hydrolase [Paenibacillus]MCY9657124.1 VPS10, VPS10 domain protein [Paenibacillus anseongense]MEB4798407.1 VPS10, VPS10 domain protein [Paenibacillus chondroitinus]
MKKSFILCMFAVTLLLVAGCSSGKSMTLMHIHGLGYSSDGKQVLIPAHDGLMSYENGKWIHGGGEKRDYMGFNAVDTGFYSSGHPAEGSSEKNPLGIVKSTDGGKTIEMLDLYGVEDFHGMAVGYKTHAIYVFNHSPNSKMSTAGLYYSLDDAKSWTKSNMGGVSGEVMAVAAHPTDPATVALVTKAGLYLSKDSGNHFDKASVAFQVTGLSFDMAGELMIGGQKGMIIKNANASMPKLDQDDAVQYLAQSPTNVNEIVVVTYKKNVFMSNDTGVTWTQIVKVGTTITK